MRIILAAAALLFALAEHSVACLRHDASQTELDFIVSLLADSQRPGASLAFACLSGVQGLATGEISASPHYNVRYGFVWEPHANFEGISFRHAQTCTQPADRDPFCVEPTTQASVYGGPWFHFDDGLRREDVLSFVGLVRLLLDDGQAVLDIEPWTFAGGYDYAVVIGAVGEACAQLHPIRLDCSSRKNCTWTIGLDDWRRCS
jgi:hypothetical protein